MFDATTSADKNCKQAIKDSNLLEHQSQNETKKFTNFFSDDNEKKKTWGRGLSVNRTFIDKKEMRECEKMSLLFFQILIELLIAHS